MSVLSTTSEAETGGFQVYSITSRSSYHSHDWGYLVLPHKVLTSDLYTLGTQISICASESHLHACILLYQGENCWHYFEDTPPAIFLGLL